MCLNGNVQTCGLIFLSINTLKVQVIQEFIVHLSEVPFSNIKLNSSFYHLHYHFRASGNALVREATKNLFLQGDTQWIESGQVCRDYPGRSNSHGISQIIPSSHKSPIAFKVCRKVKITTSTMCYIESTRNCLVRVYKTNTQCHSLIYNLDLHVEVIFVIVIFAIEGGRC